MKSFLIQLPIGVAAALLLAGCGPRHAAPSAGRYEDLVALFQEWRAFQQPKLLNGVPDYSAQAMREQRRELANYQRRLAAMDTNGWPVSPQVDYHLVRAEINGLEFDHRVHRPWARNPAFYVTVSTIGISGTCSSCRTAGTMK